MFCVHIITMVMLLSRIPIQIKLIVVMANLWKLLYNCYRKNRSYINNFRAHLFVIIIGLWQTKSQKQLVWKCNACLVPELSARSQDNYERHVRWFLGVFSWIMAARFHPPVWYARLGLCEKLFQLSSWWISISTSGVLIFRSCGIKIRRHK